MKTRMIGKATRPKAVVVSEPTTAPGKSLSPVETVIAKDCAMWNNVVEADVALVRLVNVFDVGTVFDQSGLLPPCYAA